MVLSTALFDKPAFQNLIVNGLVLAEDGKKMSKRLKNYPDPTLVVDEHGADALRLYLINSPVVKGETLKFSKEGVKGVLREVMIPWFNAYNFFAQQVERWEGGSVEGARFVRDEARANASSNAMDKWISASLEGLVQFVHCEMRAYRLYTVVPRLVGFLGDLTNWYVRLNRQRLKGGEGEESALTSLATLFEVLLKMATLMAPFTPFFAEFLYQKLRRRLPAFHDANAKRDELGKAESVHYCMLPSVNEARYDPAVVSAMGLLQNAVELGRRARDGKISMKTPVKSVVVVCADADALAQLKHLEPYVLDELNSWSLQLTSDVDTWCSLTALPKLPVLAKRLGKRVKLVTDAIKRLDSAQLRLFLKLGSLTVAVDDGGEPVTIGPDELIVKTQFAGDESQYSAQTLTDGSLTVAVETTQDDQVRMQGIAREVVNRVNKLRKKAKLQLCDQVDVFYCDAQPAGLATEAALAANQAMLDKAKIHPLPLALKGKQRSLARDDAECPYGATSLSVELCRPSASLSPDATKRFQAQNQLGPIHALLATLSPDRLAHGQKNIKGSLDAILFDLVIGKDLFADATAANKPL